MTSASPGTSRWYIVLYRVQCTDQNDEGDSIDDVAGVTDDVVDIGEYPPGPRAAKVEVALQRQLKRWRPAGPTCSSLPSSLAIDCMLNTIWTEGIR